MTDNTTLAKFIYSIGSLNNYASTLAQTKKALDENSVKPLNQDGDDVAIFSDALKGITAIQKIGFSVDGIIAVNKQFDSPSDEQPVWPGHLRNAYYNEDDRISITVDEKSRQGYIPPEIVHRQDLADIVDSYQHSEHSERQAWLVFARLAKLQPFQDGNKRTALIAANAAFGSLETGNYLVIPFNDLDRIDFVTNLMRYYSADTTLGESKAFDRMMKVLPSDREVELHKPISNLEGHKLPTKHYKPMFRDNDMNL